MPPTKRSRALSLALGSLLVAAPSPATAGLETQCTGTFVMDDPANSVIELVTSLGSICFELFEQRAPQNAANFLSYLDDFPGTFFHRAASGFVIQGGGYAAGQDSVIREIPRTPPVIDELCVPTGLTCAERGNERGTVAMAKTGLPNSATSEFFINLGDNRSTLDVANGGFTVIGKVLGDGMQVVDAIAMLPQESSPYDILPYSLLLEYQSLMLAMDELPLQSLPTPDPAGYGCFDPAKAALLYRGVDKADDQPGGLLFSDLAWSESSLTPLIASGGCGTQLQALADFKAEDSTNPECPDKDRFGASMVWCPEFASQGFPFCGGPNPPYRLTCDQVQASIQSLGDRWADLGPKYAAQLVVIQSATKLPEPGLPSALLAGLVTLALHRRRAARRPRRQG